MSIITMRDILAYLSWDHFKRGSLGDQFATVFLALIVLLVFYIVISTLFAFIKGQVENVRDRAKRAKQRKPDPTPKT